MTGVVVVAHGELGQAMVRTAELIVGQQRAVAAVSLEAGDGLEDIRGKILQAVERVRGARGVLVLTDMLGGTPSLASLQLAGELSGGFVDVVAGMSLPVLLEVLLKRDQLTREQLVKMAVKKGKDCVVHANPLSIKRASR